MYPASFEYVVPASLEEAVDALGRYEDDAKVLAGGMSLIPLMKLRLAAPQALVDINRLPGLDTLATSDGGLRIGALVRHRTCERSALLGGRWGTLGAAAPLISDPIVRNVGTVCGALAHADPQGDWGSALLAMRAEVVAQGPDGTRTIPLDELFDGPFVSTLAPTEIITEVRVPDPGPDAGGTYLKLERKVGDYATVGVAVHLAMDDGKVARAGIALTAVGPTNLRATAAEEALAGSELTDAAIREAARLAAEAARPYSDIRGTADYKRTVVRVFTERGLRAAAEAVGHPVPGRSAADGAPRTTEAALEATDRQDYFSGEETVAGVMDELEDKPGGPDGGER
jgi:aerobic carbon-monoxide dehydrogenase medium subunit